MKVWITFSRSTTLIHDTVHQSPSVGWVSTSATRGLPNSTQLWIHYPNDWALSANHPPLHNAPASCPPSILHWGCLGCQVTQRWGHQQLPLSWSTGCTVVLALGAKPFSAILNPCWKRESSNAKYRTEHRRVERVTIWLSTSTLSLKIAYISRREKNEVNSILIQACPCWSALEIQSLEPPNRWTSSQVAARLLPPAYTRKNAPWMQMDSLGLSNTLLLHHADTNTYTL